MPIWPFVSTLQTWSRKGALYTGKSSILIVTALVKDQQFNLKALRKGAGGLGNVVRDSFSLMVIGKM